MPAQFFIDKSDIRLETFLFLVCSVNCFSRKLQDFPVQEMSREILFNFIFPDLFRLSMECRYVPLQVATVFRDTCFVCHCTTRLSSSWYGNNLPYNTYGSEFVYFFCHSCSSRPSIHRGSLVPRTELPHAAPASERRAVRQF